MFRKSQSFQIEKLRKKRSEKQLAERQLAGKRIGKVNKEHFEAGSGTKKITLAVKWIKRRKKNLNSVFLITLGRVIPIF